MTPALSYIDNDFGKTWVASHVAAKRGVHVPLLYIDLNDGNIYDAIIFSQIMYWHEPSTETGQPRLKREKDGHLWLYKNHGDWLAECRIPRATARKCLDRIKARNLIIYDVGGEAGKASPFMRVNWDEFEKRMKVLLSNETPKNKPRKHAKKKPAPVSYQGTPPVPQENTPVPYQGISNTESTAITTNKDSLDASLSSDPRLNETPMNISTEPDEVIPTPAPSTEEIKVVPQRKPGSFGALHPEMSDEELDALAAKQEAEEAERKQNLFDANTAKAEYEAAMLNVVGIVFKAGGGMKGEAGNYVRMLSGTVKIGRKKRKLEPDVWDEQSELFKDNPVKPDELSEWHRDWLSKNSGISMLKDPIKVASSIDIFRRERKQVAVVPKSNDMVALYAYERGIIEGKGA
jgi:hypothetical protein